MKWTTKSQRKYIDGLLVVRAKPWNQERYSQEESIERQTRRKP